MPALPLSIRRDRVDRSGSIDVLSDRLVDALRPCLMPDPRRPGWSESYLADVCRASVARVASDPRTLPMASRSLFTACRSLMRAQDQLIVSQIVARHLERVRDRYAADRDARGFDESGRRCAALNRKGKPCGREPLWGTPFCVSHTPRTLGD